MYKSIALLVVVVGFCWNNVFALPVEIRLPGVQHGYVQYTDEQGHVHHDPINKSGCDYESRWLRIKTRTAITFICINVVVRQFTYVVDVRSRCLELSRAGINAC